MRVTLLMVLVALATMHRAAGAQITVTPVRDLGFGPVLVGVESYVPPTHPVRSGQYRVVAEVPTRVRFRFTLPNRLDGPGSATLPIAFGNSDAIAVGTAANSVADVFNPKSSAVTQNLPAGTTHVFIGGTVSPAGNQQHGTYTGTITFTVTVF